ncbi:E3 ubiquitin-protein ligase ZNRF4 [Pan troglodytes]|uniref:E3 ubiquitin-protein ligase ZNRF4 n=1 Tax=Pan troglodytes TaxID=9598 RepID=G2HIC5_PANTR|nr:E3 ubiquitin-protein ligase ZNRF4 [Pan troglodytes]BAK63483.1 zinc and ring finger 4 [Pan troglodytes]
MPRASRVTVAASLPLSHAVIPTQLPSRPGHRPPGRPRRCPKASCLPPPVGPSSTQPAKRVTMGWPRPGRALVAVKALLVLSLLQVPAQAVVRAMLEDNSSSVDFADLPALFGVPLAPKGIRGYLMEVKPANACHPIEAPRLGNRSLGAIALIRRYNCTFDLKVLNAQRAGFKAAIIHNVHSDGLVSMTHVYEDLRGQIATPSVFVSEAASQDPRVIPGCDKSAHVPLLPDDPPCHGLDCHPVLTVSWVLGCTLALVVSAFFVLNRLWLWAQACCSHRRPVKTSTCQKAQVGTFTWHNDLCAICLDEYKEGDQLKILPCSHTYHRKCIDPWFSQAPRRSCPVCKQSVAATEDSFDSTTDSFRDEDPSLPGHRPRIWAIQVQLRSRRLELLGRASPRCHCSTTSLEVEVTTVSSAPPEAPGQ